MFLIVFNSSGDVVHLNVSSPLLFEKQKEVKHAPDGEMLMRRRNIHTMRVRRPNRFAAPDSTNETYNISNRMIQLGISMISIGHKINVLTSTPPMQKSTTNTSINQNDISL